MAVTQIDLIKRLNGSGVNNRMYARSDGSGLWVPRDPLASPLFVDSSDATKQVQFTLNNIPTSTTLTAPWDTNGMSDDIISYQELTVTTTGDLYDFNIASGIGNATFLRMNNASLTTIRGLLGGRAGKWVIIHSIGAGAVDITNLDAGNAGSNVKISTGISQTIHLAAGSASYAILRYEAVTGYWQVLGWEQGIQINYTPTWTCVGTAPAIGNGTLSGSYYRKGQFMFFNIQLTAGTTTTFGTGGFTFTVPITIAGRSIGGGAVATNPGVANYGGITIFIATSTSFQLAQNSGTKVQVSSPFTFTGVTGLCLEIDGFYIPA